MYKLAAILSPKEQSCLQSEPRPVAFLEELKTAETETKISELMCTELMLFKQNKYCYGGGDIIYLQTLPNYRSRILLIVAVPAAITPTMFFQQQLSDPAITCEVESLMKLELSQKP